MLIRVSVFSFDPFVSFGVCVNRERIDAAMLSGIGNLHPHTQRLSL